MQNPLFYFRNISPLFITAPTFIVLFILVIILGGRSSAVSANSDDSTSTTMPVVLASIRPLALLAQDVVGEYGSVDVLLPNQASPHDYALSVSDRQSLVSADVVLWVGEELERFLSKPIKQRDKTVITAIDLESIQWPEDEANEHDHGAGGHGHGSSHGGRDPHIWLNPLNHAPIIDALVKELSRLFPDYSPYYQRNGDALKTELIALDQRLLRETRAPIESAPAIASFIVAHPAYTHFVTRYQLPQLDYVASIPERRAGAKHLYRVRQLAEVACVFEDYGWTNVGAQQLAQALDVPLLSLNPFGVEEKRGDQVLAESASITLLIARLWDDFQQCGMKK
jgi:zinc transport system substrate-binding protein